MRCPLLTLLFLCLLSSGIFASNPTNSPGSEEVTHDVSFFVSSNNNSRINRFDVTGNVPNFASTYITDHLDSDGIYYDEDADVIYQIDRTNNRVVAYSNYSTSPTLTASSTSDFTNGRGLTFVDGKLVVAQDGSAGNGDQNKLVVYNASPTAITLANTYDVNINLWGIQANGSRLFAVIDNSNQVAIFNDFFSNPNGTIAPSSTITVDNLTRTHGLTYDNDNDLLILTDIGDAALAGDGALVIIKNFGNASADNTITASEQIRVSGGTSQLGNPVDVAFYADENQIYVAERARDGGKVLGFNMPTLSGGIAPFYVQSIAGASSIFLSGNEAGLCDNVSGGAVSLAGGGTSITITVNDGIDDVLTFVSDAPANVGNFTYVVTDANGIILGIPPGDMQNFEPAGVGACLVYGIGYTGNLLIEAGDDLLANGLQISDACFSMSINAITVNREDVCADVSGGAVSLSGGGTAITITVNDGIDDVLTFVSDAPANTGSFTYVVTDANGIILGIPPGDMQNFEPAGVGACLVYGIGYTGNLLIEAGDDLLANGLQISDACFSMSINAITVNRTDICDEVDGGLVSLTNGGTSTTIIVNDGQPNVLSFNSSNTGNAGTFTYVITDANGMILGIPPGNSNDFEPAGVGACLVYGLSYTGNLNIVAGDNLLMPGLVISDGCFDLSNNKITVNRIEAAAPDLTFYVSSNGQSNIAVFDVQENGGIIMSNIDNEATDADGIFYDQDNDVIYQLNRDADRIDIYNNISVNPTFIGSSGAGAFSNGREIAVAGDKLVVADDVTGANQLVVFDITPTSVTLNRIHSVDINLWGIHAHGGTLFAVVDNSNTVAVFNDFFNQPAGALATSSTFSVENLIRTHGLTYNAERDMMFLTDIADATKAGDGALVVIKKFTTASSDGMISASEQIRISGGGSFLGNPVDVAFDSDNNRVYVAERARDGGRVLGFSLPVATGGQAPLYNKLFFGASAIHLPGDKAPGLCDNVDGGLVSLASGGLSTTIFVNDGQDDVLSFNSSAPAAVGVSFTYVVTDANGIILGIPPGNSNNFEPAGVGACLVYGLSYTGSLNIMAGNDLLMPGLQISSGCFDLSNNKITVNRIDINAPTDAKFYVSSNTSSNIGIFSVFSDGNIGMTMTASQAMDADGIYYDDVNDVLYQLNRTDDRVDVYSNFSTTPTLVASSTSDFTNGREIAVVEGKLIVADDVDGANQLVVYDITTNSITLDKVFSVGINLWGIHVTGTTLYAVIDNSNMVAIYENFFANAAGALTPTSTFAVDNLVRTHGITYNAERDMMFLTDVGDGALAGDGAIILIKQFRNKVGDGVITASEQIRISGGTSLLGNPVDIAFDSDDNMVYVAERAREGGLVLGFVLPAATGGLAPKFVKAFPGASAIHLPGDDAPTLCDNVQARTVALSTGGTEITIVVNDAIADVISFINTAPTVAGINYRYVITDSDGMVLGVPPADSNDFEPAGVGACLVFGLAYTGNLLVTAGDDIFDPNLLLSDDCFDISDNELTVFRVDANAESVQFFASSNTQTNVGVFNVSLDNNVSMSTFANQSMDADGIFYDVDQDVLYQLNRTENRIDVYGTVSTTPTLISSSTATDFLNGREIAVNDNFVIVSQDAAPINGNRNRFIIYTRNPDNSLTLDRKFTTTINLWGIHLIGNRLFAIVDNSNQVASFNNFFNNVNGSTISPTSALTVEGLIRTHGITYDNGSKTMILTDIGDAAKAGDGAIVVIRAFNSASADGVITASEQIRIAGGTSLLGNPVDVAVDKINNRIYVAERANGGGRILGFRMPELSGGAAPVYNQLFAGASAIHLPHPAVDNLTEEAGDTRDEVIAEPTITPVKLYPVPTRDVLNLSLTSELAQSTTIMIFDVTGALQQSVKVELVKGENTITFDVQRLASGMHFISIPEIDFKARFVKLAN